MVQLMSLLLCLLLVGLAVWWNIQGDAVYRSVTNGHNGTTYFLTPDYSPLAECDFLGRNLGDS